MKKILFAMGVMLAATFTLTNCTKELQNPNEVEKTPYTIYANPVDTKTTNEGMHTIWYETDALNVFHAPAGSTSYSNNSKFAVKDTEAGIFETEALQGTPSASNDWYALYPYNDKVMTPASTSAEGGYMYIGHRTSLVQKEGFGDTQHLAGSNCALYGVAKGVAGDDIPSMKMQHLTSVVKVVVTNTSGKEAAIETVALTAEEDIVGSYYIDITGNAPVYTSSDAQYVSNTAAVSVKGNNTLAAEATGDVYIVIKPFTASANEKLVLSVNGYEKELTLEKDVTFHAGKIKTLKFDYDYDDVEVIDGDKIEWTSSEDWTGIGEVEIGLESGDYSVVINKQSGSTSPTVNPNANDCRAYAKSTITISHSSKNITSLVFHLSAQGLKRLTDITPSTGKITIDTENGQVVWTGDAASVTFTVGEKAVYGTDGETKAGQLCFNYIVAKTGGAVNPEPDQPTGPQTVTIAEFNAAEDGDTVYELTGTITEIYQAYNSTYNNVSFYIEDATDRTLIFRMSCEGVADPTTISVGDEITVQGTKTTYNESPQMAEGGKCINYVDKAGSTPEQPGEPQPVTVAEFLAAAEDETIYELTGVITRITTPYDSKYNNISFNISDETGEVAIYRMSCEGVSDPTSLTVGDEITLQGCRSSYNGSPQMAQGGKYISHIDKEAPAPEEGTYSLSFSDVANRTSYSTEQQVWEQNGIKLTNNKAASTSNVADYVAPARFYKSSSLKIEKAGMSKIVFYLNSGKPASGLIDSISDSNATVSADGYDVTIIFAKAVDVFEIASLANQIRVDILEVYTN